MPVKKKGKGGEGEILLAREIYGCGLDGLEQNYELVVILVLQQDQGAVNTGEDLCVCMKTTMWPIRLWR